MKKNNCILEKFALIILSMVILSICISCGNSNKNVNATTTTETTATKNEIQKIDISKKINKKIMRATKSSPDKNPSLDKVKITGTLQGSINKPIESQAEISTNNKDVTFSVAQNMITGLKVGDTTMVNTPNGQYQATITSIPKTAQNGIYTVKASFPTAIPKMSTRIFPCTYNYKKQRTRYIPRSVVYYEDSRPYVYIVDYDDIVRKQYIDLGIQSDAYIEILEGLLDDAFILTDWTEEIEVGEEVRYEVDSNDFIDDNYIITKTSDSLTVSDGDTEITFYDDGSFGGGGNFSNEYYYEHMADQYDYDSETTSDSINDNDYNPEYEYRHEDTSEEDYSDHDNIEEEHSVDIEEHYDDNHEVEYEYEVHNEDVEEYSEEIHTSIPENDPNDDDDNNSNYEAEHNNNYDADDYQVEQDDEIQYTTPEDQIDDPGMNYDDAVDNDSEELE